MTKKVNLIFLEVFYIKQELPINEQIRAKQVQLIDDEGQKRGEISDEVPVNELVRYYSMCERALVSDWCLNKGAYSLGEYSKQCMPIMLEHFKK